MTGAPLKTTTPDIAWLSEHYTYNPESGVVWRRRDGLLPHRHNAGYLVFNHGHTKLKAHRIAFALMCEYWPKTVDHINGVKHDNRWCNLREVTDRQNQILRWLQKSAPQIRQLSNGTWHTNVQFPREWRRSFTHPDKSVVERKRDEWVAERAAKRNAILADVIDLDATEKDTDE